MLVVYNKKYFLTSLKVFPVVDFCTITINDDTDKRSLQKLLSSVLQVN